jgi:uncharacterized protein CbrC (UPF0167 family)
MDLPKFRLSPNAYALDLFVAESGICSCCGQARELKYNSSFYSREEPDYLCPWCIADGSAAQHYEGEFNDYLGIEGVSADPDEPDSIVMDRVLLLEVCERTPSYHSWQQEQWLVHCNQPCAFVGYTDYAEIRPCRPSCKPILPTCRSAICRPSARPVIRWAATCFAA